MDRHQLIGLILISVMLIAYAQYFAPKPQEKLMPEKGYQGPVGERDLALSLREERSSTSHTHIPLEKDGIEVPAKQDVEREVVLENEVVKVTLTSWGGRIKKVVLKNYQDYQKQPLTLLDEKSSAMGFQYTVHGTQCNTNTSFFKMAVQDRSGENTNSTAATFTLPIAPGQYIRNTFTLPDKGYTLTHKWEIVGLNNPSGQTPLQFVWHNLIKRVEGDLQACRNKTTVNYYLANGKFGHLKEAVAKEQEQSLQSPVQWIGIKQRFFTAGLISEKPFVDGRIATTPTPQSMTTVKEARVCLTLPITDSEEDKIGLFTFYFGPNDYQTLSQVTEGFSNNISLGWPVVRWINQFLIIPVFNFLEQYVSSYGIIIILLVILIKCLLLPLSYKSYISMAKMRMLKPAIDALKAQYGEDMQKIQMEQMSLYREMGINPLSGCIPVLLQMPILLAMFNFFPNAIALRQQPFLWASDLSTYDAIIHLPFSIPAYGSHVSLFTLLMTASTILYTWSNEQLSPAQGPMRFMTYMMPLTFMFVLNSFPAGLSFYYFISNLVTFGQQSLIKWFVDEEKIKNKLEANRLKNKNKKKSRFQVHLEEVMKVEGKSRKKK